MVLLYKDPDGMDVFPTQTGPQFTVDMTQGGQQDFVDIDAFKHKIKQLENELMKIKYNKVCITVTIRLPLNPRRCSDHLNFISHRKCQPTMKRLHKAAKYKNKLLLWFQL